MMLSCLQKMKSIDQAILEVFYVKNQPIWLVERFFSSKLKSQTDKLLEINNKLLFL